MGVQASLFMTVVGSGAENDVELGTQFTGLRIGHRQELDHEMLHWLAHATDQAVFFVSLMTIDEALGGQNPFVLAVNGHVNVRSAWSVGNGFDGAEVVAAIASCHESSEALEVVVPLGALQAAIARVDIRTLVVDLPDFHPSVGNRVALQIGHFAMKVSDRSNRRRDPIVDSQEIIVGIEWKLVGVERSFGHRRGGGESFSKGPGSGEKGG